MIDQIRQSRIKSVELQIQQTQEALVLNEQVHKLLEQKAITLEGILEKIKNETQN